MGGARERRSRGSLVLERGEGVKRWEHSVEVLYSYVGELGKEKGEVARCSG